MNNPPPLSRFAYTDANLRQLADDALNYARKLGATAIEVGVSEGFGQSVNVRLGEVDNIEYNRDKGIGLSIYLGQKKGYASTSDFSTAALRQTVEAALAIARHTAEDAAAGPPEVELLATEFPQLDLHHPWQLSVEEAIALAKRSEQAAFAHSPKITNSEGASVSLQESQFISANSLGFMGGFPSSQHYVHCCVIAEEGEQMQRDDWYSAGRLADLLESPEAIGEKAAQRSLARLHGRKLKTGNYPVLFEAPQAAGLIGSLVHAASGGMLFRKASFLVDSLGTQLFPDFIQLRECPHLPRAIASAPFDNEGVATQTREVVADGILQGYFLSAYSARKLGMRSTGNAGGNHNLILQSGSLDLPGLLRQMDKGLFVTELLGQGINYINGDYSRGAAGFWIENGAIAYPVEEITIAGNLRDMFANIVAVGTDVDRRGSKQCGSILLNNMMVAGS